ncbi:hypothetical protein OKA05_07165 [Luteolibacter arcticus]|uniref:Uncharacterized protein n=1 Tax=Luteolibacter arcticus TaxID=1581411 RepID=A0ABT3GFD3_9BACT|nr:hypothetical protein [Luteolibacter arcticus]MCW1922328.1 hypothetical protein [Luteolibacter arcticus]
MSVPPAINSERKNAYRHLLYAVFVHMRAGHREAVWWRPASWFRTGQELRKLKELADRFHNLAFFSLHDFKNFDEERFWQDIVLLGRSQGPELAERCRRIFDEYLTGRSARLL